MTNHLADRRAELLKAWPQGFVSAPGRFKGEPIAALYFWNLVLDGSEDDSLYDGDTRVRVFRVTAEDRDVWQLDAETAYVALSETEQECVVFHEWTDLDYRAALDAVKEVG
jgi:hypothetical protein